MLCVRTVFDMVQLQRRPSLIFVECQDKHVSTCMRRLPTADKDLRGCGWQVRTSREWFHCLFLVVIINFLRVPYFVLEEPYLEVIMLDPMYLTVSLWKGSINICGVAQEMWLDSRCRLLLCQIRAWKEYGLSDPQNSPTSRCWLDWGVSTVNRYCIPC